MLLGAGIEITNRIEINYDAEQSVVQATARLRL
jgi:hypothetical protein